LLCSSKRIMQLCRFDVDWRGVDLTPVLHRSLMLT